MFVYSDIYDASWLDHIFPVRKYRLTHDRLLSEGIAAPGDSIALMDIDMIGFHSRLRVIDITGLTDAHIAAAPGPMLQKRYDPGYVLEQEPAWIVLVGRAPALPRRTAEATLAGRSFALDPEALWFQDRQLARRPRFARDYEFVLSRHARHEGWLHLFRRR